MGFLTWNYRTGHFDEVRGRQNFEVLKTRKEPYVPPTRAEYLADSIETDYDRAFEFFAKGEDVYGWNCLFECEINRDELEELNNDRIRNEGAKR